jgi:hypothetical protein
MELSNNPDLHANRIEELDAPVLKYVIEILLGVLDLKHLSQSLLLHNNANLIHSNSSNRQLCQQTTNKHGVMTNRQTNAEAMKWKMGLRCVLKSPFLI